MRVTSHRLAAALAGRIGEVLPAPLTVRAEGSDLAVYADGVDIGGAAAAVIVEDDDDCTPADRAETAVRAVLDAIQDCVAEHLTRPWPADAIGGMAMPDARAGADGVHAWFGASEADAVLALRPIPFAEIMA